MTILPSDLEEESSSPYPHWEPQSPQPSALPGACSGFSLLLGGIGAGHTELRIKSRVHETASIYVDFTKMPHPHGLSEAGDTRPSSRLLQGRLSYSERQLCSRGEENSGTAEGFKAVFCSKVMKNCIAEEY